MKLMTLAALVVTAAAAAPLCADELRPFTAHYNIAWKGMHAGRSSIILKRLDGGRWSYESRNVARGMFRIALPGDISQTSVFRIEDQLVVPEHFRGEDGTSATRKDVDMRFDWEAQRAAGTVEDRKVEVTVARGTQDGMSVQAALMVELMLGRTPSSFLMLDKDKVKEYLYTREGTETLDTALGRKETVIFRSRRPDSKHSTMFWCAPDLGFIPLKVERRDGEKVEWSMSVQSASRE